MGIQYNQLPNPFAVSLTDQIPAALASQLGRGLSHKFLLVNNEFETLAGVAKVKQDIFITIATPVGRHLLQPDFGSMVPYLPFEQYTTALNASIIQTTTNAVNTWCPNVLLQKVLIDTTNLNNNYINLIIQFSIKGTQASNSVNIVIATSDSVQLPASDFVLNGRQLLGV